MNLGAVGDNFDDAGDFAEGMKFQLVDAEGHVSVSWKIALAKEERKKNIAGDTEPLVRRRCRLNTSG